MQPSRSPRGKPVEKPKPSRGTSSKTYRWVTAMVGLLFVSIAIIIIYTADSSNRVGAYGAALAVGGLGLDAMISAARDRSSLLSRIGPMP